MLGQLAQVAQDGSRVAALDLWVDASGVVRQATFTMTGTEKVDAYAWRTARDPREEEAA
jgi:hypothetical protein